MISPPSQARREPSTGRERGTKRWEFSLMLILKLTHAQEKSLTLGLFQINESEVVPAPASKVML
jgi:hypothetical protein